jgi:hypothetical protein
MGPVMIPLRTLRAIEAGQVSAAFRRWDRPRVLPGTRMRTTVGLIEVTSVKKVNPDTITEGQARKAGSSLAELHKFLSRKDGQVYRVGLKHAGADPRIALRADDGLSGTDLAVILGKLSNMDKRDPWTRTFLALIEASPAVRAPDLASGLGWETLVFKRYVRKLKELGLTESLEVGYRLSPRGAKVLAALREGPAHSLD